MTAEPMAVEQSSELQAAVSKEAVTVEVEKALEPMTAEVQLNHPLLASSTHTLGL